MPRGQHANSRANLAGAAGGDRYAGKRLIIAAIEEALRTLENGREIREFFGLGPARVLKQKHRDRWAEVKAPEVYQALVDSMSESIVKGAYGSGGRSIDDILEEYEAELREEYAGYVADGDMTQEEAEGEIAIELQQYRQQLEAVEGEKSYGVLSVGGFVRMMARKGEALYPVAANIPLAESQLDYVRCELLGFSDYFGELKAAVPAADVGWYRWELDYVTNGQTRPVQKMLAAVRQSSKITVGLTFEGSGQVEQREIDVYGARAWALLVLPDNGYWNPNPPQVVAVERYIENESDWWAVANSIRQDSSIFAQDIYWGLTVEGWNAAKEDEPSGWEFEFPILGAGRGGSVPHIASMFPRRQRVWGEIDPVNARIVYDDLRWVNWDDWQAMFAANRGIYLAAGKIVPPLVRPSEKRRLAVTFDPQFIAALNPQGGGGPAGGAPV